MFGLTFISESDFEDHVRQTIASYNETLRGINLKKFNQNLIDPIKMTFDMEIYQQSVEDVIRAELQRQRDKSNNNSIGYFHQNIFQYIDNCEVPDRGWDVVFNDVSNGRKIFVEMKNKHNTMNSASAQRTYIRMQNQLLCDSHCLCFLVEAIAPLSRNIPWQCSVDGHRMENDRIRRVSIDRFYEVATGKSDSFYRLCKQLPKTVRKLTRDEHLTAERDTVIEELRAQKGDDAVEKLYLLSFSTYEGFRDLGASLS